MKWTLLFAVALAVSAPALAHASCMPRGGYTRAQFIALKQAEFAIADDAARNALALALTPCLADPDPAIRDDAVYNAYFTWLRHRQLTDDTMRALETDLEHGLSGPEGRGFERPFSALILAEVARADRVQAYLSPEQRDRMLDASIRYLTNIRDYRGFDEHDGGWRHGVAHSADLMMQLALNPAFGRAELTRIRDAVATQIAPTGHFYIYGEDERLSNPIIYIASRNVFNEAEWTAWFAQVAASAPFAKWDDAFKSQAGLARVHDLKGFLFPLWANSRLSDAPGIVAMRPGLDAVLRTMP
jgi:hypothetical protein